MTQSNAFSDFYDKSRKSKELLKSAYNKLDKIEK